MKLILVDESNYQDVASELRPCEGFILRETMTLVFGCPKCGNVAHHVKNKYNEQTKTASPSIKCVNCDFHAMLVNGEFKPC